MNTIKRVETGARMSKAVIHNGVAYLAGQTGDPDAPFADQVRQTLAKIEEALALIGSDKTKLLQAVIWLDDMRNFDVLNEIWDAWVPQGCAHARACGEVRMARPSMGVEITIIAAVKRRYKLAKGKYLCDPTDSRLPLQ